MLEVFETPYFPWDIIKFRFKKISWRPQEIWARFLRPDLQKVAKWACLKGFTLPMGHRDVTLSRCSAVTVPLHCRSGVQLIGSLTFSFARIREVFLNLKFQGTHFGGNFIDRKQDTANKIAGFDSIMFLSLARTRIAYKAVISILLTFLSARVSDSNMFLSQQLEWQNIWQL